MNLSTINEWLSWIDSFNPREINLGLDRVKEVAKRLNLLTPQCPVIIVGGTNGKGSTVAGLEAIYHAAGYRVGAYTSPILFRHNEQVRINHRLASDIEFCNAFAKINHARDNILLTTFEFFTLAALLIFQNYSLDVMILEVGLGGRLDAVNMIDADVAIVTNISLDHMDWLGDTREKIACEKAGIFRSGKVAIYGEMNPPFSLREIATKLGVKWYCYGHDFRYEMTDNGWDWIYANYCYRDLPINHLAIQNMAGVLMAMTLLQTRLPVSPVAINNGLSQATLPGRVQIINGPLIEIYDVSHNPASVAHLCERVQEMECDGKTYAVFSMLADKDLVESMGAIHKIIDEWYVAPLKVKRAATIQNLMQAFHQVGILKVNSFSSIPQAYDAAKTKARQKDRIIIFGSFHTVAEVGNYPTSRLYLHIHARAD